MNLHLAFSSFLSASSGFIMHHHHRQSAFSFALWSFVFSRRRPGVHCIGYLHVMYPFIIHRPIWQWCFSFGTVCTSLSLLSSALSVALVNITTYLSSASCPIHGIFLSLYLFHDLFDLYFGCIKQTNRWTASCTYIHNTCDTNHDLYVYEY